MSRNRLIDRRRLSGVFAVAAMMIASPGAWAADEVQITIQGEIEPSCGLTGAQGMMQLGDVSVAGERALAFTVNCNAPFSYALVSEHGGLAASSGTMVVGGEFQVLKPYAVSTRFQTDVGMFGDSALQSGNLTVAAAAPCLSVPYSSSCPFSSSGSGVAINQTGELRLNWTAATTPLIAGSYADIIVLTVRAL